MAKLGKMKKGMAKSRKRVFCHIWKHKLEEANNSDLTDSYDDEDDESSHFQFAFQQVHATAPIQELDMKNIIILLDNESTMDLFCNKAICYRSVQHNEP